MCKILKSALFAAAMIACYIGLASAYDISFNDPAGFRAAVSGLKAGNFGGSPALKPEAARVCQTSGMDCNAGSPGCCPGLTCFHYNSGAINTCYASDPNQPHPPQPGPGPHPWPPQPGPGPQPWNPQPGPGPQPWNPQPGPGPQPWPPQPGPGPQPWPPQPSVACIPGQYTPQFVAPNCRLYTAQGQQACVNAGCSWNVNGYMMPAYRCAAGMYTSPYAAANCYLYTWQGQQACNNYGCDWIWAR